MRVSSGKGTSGNDKVDKAVAVESRSATSSIATLQTYAGFESEEKEVKSESVCEVNEEAVAQLAYSFKHIALMDCPEILF